MMMIHLLARLIAQDYTPIPKPPGLPGPKLGIDATETFKNFLGFGADAGTVPRWLGTFIGVVGGLSVFMLILGGILFLTAYGDDERLTKAKKTVTWAIVGLLLALFSYTIVQIIVSLPLTRGPSR